MTVADILTTLGQVTGRPAPRLHIPYPIALTYAAVAQTLARLGGGKTLVSIVGVRMLQARLRVSSARAESELGWRARPFQETLRDEVAWYRSQGMATRAA
jgi:nucleoside-diphosphate-sugar epimerase